MNIKQRRLRALAQLRQKSRCEGYLNIGEVANGAYECDHVSPFTKTAGNVDARMMVLLQDWSSARKLDGEIRPELKTLGYTPELPTNRNLTGLLQRYFAFSLSDIYATNIFPFIKPGGMSARIRNCCLVSGAKGFALPQVQIVEPKVVVCLGLVTFNALRNACGLAKVKRVADAVEKEEARFKIGLSEVWCQAHTGSWGISNRGAARVQADWARMAAATRLRESPG